LVGVKLANGGSVSIDWGAIGRYAGSEAAKQLRGEIQGIKTAMEGFTEAHRQVGQAIDKMAIATNKNAENIKDLRDLIHNLEITKARAKLTLSNVNEKVIELKNKAESTMGEETKQIQSDYDGSMTELIREFVKDIRHTHTGNLDFIKDEFTYLDGLKESFLEDTMVLRRFQHPYYEKRRKQLYENKSEVLTTIEVFLAERESIRNRIEDLNVKLSIQEPTTFLYPFWLIGFEDEEESKEYAILPILNISPPRGTPSEERPYVQHLSDHANFSLTKNNFSQDLLEKIINSSKIEEIDGYSILPYIHEYSDELRKLMEKGYYSRDFFEALMSFYRDGIYTPHISPYLSYDTTQDYLPQRTRYGLPDMKEEKSMSLPPHPPRIVASSEERKQKEVDSLPIPRPPRIVLSSTSTENIDRKEEESISIEDNERMIERTHPQMKLLPEIIDNEQLEGIHDEYENKDIEQIKMEAKLYNERLFKIFQRAICQGIEIREHQLEYEAAIEQYKSGNYYSSIKRFEEVESDLISVMNPELENGRSTSDMDTDEGSAHIAERREEAKNLANMIEEDIIKKSSSSSPESYINTIENQSSDTSDAVKLIEDIQKDILSDPK